MKIILGSASARRRQILQDHGYQFEIIPPGIDEKAIRDEDSQRLVLALANAKADAVLSKISEPAIIITSDQVVSFENKIIEKPAHLDEARMLLKSYENKSVETITSVVVTNSATGDRYSGVDIAKVYFRTFPDHALEAILKSQEINVLDRAGGFAVEHSLVAPYIEKIEGELESIQGLPKALTAKLLKQALAV